MPMCVCFLGKSTNQPRAGRSGWAGKNKHTTVNERNVFPSSSTSGTCWAWVAVICNVVHFLTQANTDGSPSTNL